MADAAPQGARSEVVVALDEHLLTDGMADTRWLLHDVLRSGARIVVVDRNEQRVQNAPGCGVRPGYEDHDFAAYGPEQLRSVSAP